MAGSASPAFHRRVIALLAPASFFEGYDGMVLGLALPLIAREFHLDFGQRGIVASLASIGTFGVFALLPLADRVGRRPVLAWTIAGYTAATFLTGLSRGVVDFVAWQILARVFLGAEAALAAIVLVDLLPVERRGRALGLVASMSAFGQAAAGIGFLLAVAGGWSWRWLYLVGILPLVLVGRARRDLPETLATATSGATVGAAAPQRLNHRWLWGAAGVTFLFAMLPAAITTLASSVVIDEWKWDLRSINPAYLALWVLGVGGFFVAGRLMDTVGRKPIAAAFLVGCSLAGFAAFHQTTTPGRVVGLAVVIFFVTGATPCVAAFGAELFAPERRGRAGAVMRGAAIAGSGIAPAMAGLLSGPAGGLAEGIALVGSSCLVAAAVLLVLLPETIVRLEAEQGQPRS